MNDDRTGEQIRYLLQYRGKAAGRDVINRTVIPVERDYRLKTAEAPEPATAGRAFSLTTLVSVPRAYPCMN